MTCSCDPSKPWKQATCTDHGIEKKTRPRSSRSKPPTRKPLKPVSEKQAVKNDIHNAYRDAFIFLARRYDDLKCWECGIPCTPKQLDLDHIENRGRGGKNEARNYRLVCNRFSSNGENNCHGRKHGTPRWSKKEA